MKLPPLALLPCLTFIAWAPAQQPASPFAPPHVDARRKADNGDQDDDKKDSRKPPFKGMTKAQARHFYGDPDSIGNRDGEELWTYVLNRGTVAGRSFLPFGNVKFRYRLLTFKGDKVVEFRWDKPGED